MAAKTISKWSAPFREIFSIKNGYGEFIRKYLAYISLIFLIILFRIWAGPNFTTLKNWSFIAQQAPVLIVLAIAETFVITGGFIDLSVGSVVGITCYVAALGIQHFGPIGLLLGLAVATAVGLLNGAIFAYFKIPSFVTTLATLTIIRAALLIVSNGQAVYISEGLGTSGLSADWLTGLGRYPKILFVVAIIIFITWIVYNKTVFGRNLKGVGGNENVVGLFGIPISRFKFLAFGFVGFVVGLAGLIKSCQSGCRHPGDRTEYGAGRHFSRCFGRHALDGRLWEHFEDRHGSHFFGGAFQWPDAGGRAPLMEQRGPWPAIDRCCGHCPR